MSEYYSFGIRVVILILEIIALYVFLRECKYILRVMELMERQIARYYAERKKDNDLLQSLLDTRIENERLKEELENTKSLLFSSPYKNL